MDIVIASPVAVAATLNVSSVDVGFEAPALPGRWLGAWPGGGVAVAAASPSTAPDRAPLWVSGALPGSLHDTAAARVWNVLAALSGRP